MGAKCLRAYDEFAAEEGGRPEDSKGKLGIVSRSSERSSPLSLSRDAVELVGKSPAKAVARPLFVIGDAEEEIIEADQGDLGAELEATVELAKSKAACVGHGYDIMTAGVRSLSTPRLAWFKAPQAPPTTTPVTLHVYNIGTASIGRVLNRLLKPLGTGAFHCGVEIFGCEWSYSDTTSGTGDGVFPSKPMKCEGHDYAESVVMGRTANSEQEVLKLIALLKKEWPVYEYDTLKRNCCHFSNELCQRLGLGPIPSWVMNLAGAGAAIAASGDLTCCRQMAVQVGKGCCCGEDSMARERDSAVEVVDVVEQMPVLPPRSRTMSVEETAAGRAASRLADDSRRRREP